MSRPGCPVKCPTICPDRPVRTPRPVEPVEVLVIQIASRAKAAGVTLSSEPHDTEWKTRAFEVTEPSGFKITISSEM